MSHGKYKDDGGYETYDPMFRDLDANEVLDFKGWARENYIPGSTIHSIWHPVVRAECELMNKESES